MPHGFDYEVSLRESLVVIAVSGEMDVATLVDFAGLADSVRLLDHVHDVCIDLTALSFIDSSGLRAIVLLKSLLERSGIGVSFVEGTPTIMKVLKITQLADTWTWRDPPIQDESS